MNERNEATEADGAGSDEARADLNNTTEATDAEWAPHAPTGGESGDEFPSPDELIGTFMSEASLWPVLIVVIGSGGAMGAAMLVLAGVDRNPFAAGALLLVFGVSVDVIIQARRKAVYANIAKLIGLLWCAAIGLAGVGVWTGVAL